MPLLATGCGDVARTGRAPAFVIVQSVEGASGARPGEFGTSLLSDVVTLVREETGGQTVLVPTRYNDLGRASFRLGLRNPGTAASPTAPSTLNEITLTRYRVTYRRADARNTPGVDVPYPFDGALTVTVPANGTVTAGFQVVRHQAKLESPLRNLASGSGSIYISTLAEIQFYGQDQAGNEVTVVASLSVNFGDFADPD
jgi:hypothetical protein